MMGIFARSASKSDAPSGTPTVACRPGTLSGASSKELKGEDTFAFVDRQVGPDRVTFGLLADGHGGREAGAQAEEQGAGHGDAALETPYKSVLLCSGSPALLSDDAGAARESISCGTGSWLRSGSCTT